MAYGFATRHQTPLFVRTSKTVTNYDAEELIASALDPVIRTNVNFDTEAGALNVTARSRELMEHVASTIERLRT